MAGGHDRHRWRVFVLHRIRWRVFPRTHQRNDVEAAHPALAGFLGEYAVEGHLSGWAVAKSLAGFFWPGPNRWRFFFWPGPNRWRFFFGRGQFVGGFFWAGPKSVAGFFGPGPNRWRVFVFARANALAVCLAGAESLTGSCWCIRVGP